MPVRERSAELFRAVIRDASEFADRLGRFEAIIYSSFVGLALLLAAIGTYGMMNLLVS
jgi:hypothetical protein